ncbi:hypothetical protein E4T56_gene18259 [Termitomyces sp. T112]|nr:hypothetical protein E4T56_gene18259 [Termitomyces sp. T112]
MQKTVTSKTEEEGKDMEMREKTLLVAVTEVELAVSREEVVEEAMEVEKNEESDEEARVQQHGTWTSTPLHQVGNNRLEWQGEDLVSPTPLMLAMLL